MRSLSAKSSPLLPTNISSRLIQILSDRRVTILILFTAIAARIIQLVFFYNIRVDASYQVLATMHFVNGNGISYGFVNPDDFSQVIYQPLINWPPGYSILLAPFYLLFGGNYIAAGITLDVVMAIVLIVTCRAILKELGCSLAMQNLATIINGFFIYYFYFIASSDAIAISFFCLVLLFTIRLLKQQKFDSLNVALITLFLFLIASIKYLFVPAVFVIPAFLIMKGHLAGEKTVRKAGLVSFGGLLLLIAGFLLYQMTISGQAGYISSPTRGLFLHHLTDTYPFITSSFIKPETLGMVTGLPSGPTSVFYRLLQALNLGLMLYITIAFLQKTWKRDWKDVTPAHSFFIISFLLSVIVFHVLAILSLQVSKEEILPRLLWTYVEEPRYYGLVVVLFHLSVFIFWRYFIGQVSQTPKILFYLFCFFLVLETGRGVLLTANRIKNFGTEEYTWQYEERIQKAAGAVVTNARRMFPGSTVIVTGTDYYYNHRVSLYSGAPILYEFARFINPQTSFSTKPVVVVSVVNKKKLQQLAAYQSSLGNWQADIENFSIFTKHVQPN